ncbi:alpha-amylase family glycosyl hydrolase [uncultured Tateyamaria sp.]|uniref:alpha-amylase family glycosyl hydrolase n=1 Tax=uncultured Tateyamaria sp. TaxID=455651 RepID=UPI0026162F2A|nr:alpha-amylase family glycosyl hydrolase [uncultured Tateyamaria sp.]
MAVWSLAHKSRAGAGTGWPLAPLIYELYPRSFQDSDGDGIGDLPGILRRADYLHDLGVDAVWICPFMPSPWVDGGYDVTDYCAIHPALGTMKDWSALTEALHDRGLKVMIDLVLNHTSDQHPWFDKSAQRDPGYVDHYVWRDAKEDGAPPTNWIGRFGDLSWSWDHRRQQYYLHNYMSAQPALNLRCPNVQAEVQRIFAFWTDNGVDGFRLDAVTSYLCDPEFRDNPPASPEVRDKMDGEPFLPYVRQDHKHDFLPGDGAAYCDNLRAWAGETAYLLGEVGTGNQSVEVCNDFTDGDRLNAGYVVDLAQFGFSAQVAADLIARRAAAMRLAWWTGSHDRARQPKRPDDPEARLQLMFLALMPGPALVYQGQELGLPQPELSRDDTTDPYDLAFWPDGPGREGARVPLPWSRAQANGFTTGTPWLPMRWADGIDVETQDSDGGSVLSFARQVFALRRELDLASLPDAEWQRDGDVLTIRHQTARVVFNFGHEDVKTGSDTVPDLTSAQGGTDTVLPPRSAAFWRL